MMVRVSQTRTPTQRKADVLAALMANRDLWIATADRNGSPHLIAVSAWWHDNQMTIATSNASRTARNLVSIGSARLALGSPEDVIVIDTTLMDSVPVGEADGRLGQGFAAAVGWDPRTIDPGWSFYHLKPLRIQAYRGYDELAGRDVMRNERWVS
jgi:Pyridoxamine 5'-phosphate oxidase